MKELWDLLNLVEDKIKYGYKEEHPIPEFKAPSQQVQTECRDCPLYLVRNRIVYGSGSNNPTLFILGTWPINQDEDENLPISGECQNFLNKWIVALKLSPEKDCYTTNLLKCKTGWNKRGFNGSHNIDQEITTCLNHLEAEIQRLKPKVILTLGERPAQILTDSDRGLEQLRGHVHLFKGIPVINTYHPEIALENYEELRASVWNDLKLVISSLNG